MAKKSTRRAKKNMIYPVILCGGSGTRLWPSSRKSYPKQFSALIGETSLFQATVKRLAGPEFGAPLVRPVGSCDP